jgi:hypothetical protein
MPSFSFLCCRAYTIASHHPVRTTEHRANTIASHHHVRTTEHRASTIASHHHVRTSEPRANTIASHHHARTSEPRANTIASHHHVRTIELATPGRTGGGTVTGRSSLRRRGLVSHSGLLNPQRCSTRKGGSCVELSSISIPFTHFTSLSLTFTLFRLSSTHSVPLSARKSLHVNHGHSDCRPRRVCACEPDTTALSRTAVNAGLCTS